MVGLKLHMQSQAQVHVQVQVWTHVHTRAYTCIHASRLPQRVVPTLHPNELALDSKATLLSECDTTSSGSKKLA